jgi:hypothetical protein
VPHGEIRARRKDRVEVRADTDERVQIRAAPEPDAVALRVNRRLGESALSKTRGQIFRTRLLAKRRRGYLADRRLLAREIRRVLHKKLKRAPHARRS